MNKWVTYHISCDLEHPSQGTKQYFVATSDLKLQANGLSSRDLQISSVQLVPADTDRRKLLLIGEHGKTIAGDGVPLIKSYLS